MPRLPTRTELTTPAQDDLIHVVDISDTTSDPTGTSKKVQISNMLEGMPNALLVDGTRALNGAWNLNSQQLSNVNIDSGSIDGTTIGSSLASTITGTTITANTAIITDAINEKTVASGVTIEGILLKDNNLSTSTTNPRSFVIDSTNDKTELDIKRGSTNRDVIIRYFTTSTNTWKVGMTDDSTNDFHIQDAGTTTDVIKAEYGTNGNVEINPNGTGGVLSNSHFAGLGDIDGLLVGYNTTTSVSITRGYCEANGKYYDLTADTTHSLTGLSAVGFNRYYIYIDDDSTPPTPTFINSTTAPSRNDSKMGWYNGNDRCIGAVSGRNGSATILNFVSIGRGKNVINEFGIGDAVLALPIMASNFNPTGSFVSPTNDGSDITPVMTIAIKVEISNTDSGARVSVGVNSSAFTPSGNFRGQLNYIGYDEVMSVGWVALDSTRNILISGIDTNDNNLDVTCVGYEYTR
jgi:hypothetical protein